MTERVRVVFDAPVVQVGQPVIQVTAAQPGLQGRPGVADPDALRVSQRLAEFNTPDAKAAARANLDLQHIDCGEF